MSNKEIISISRCASDLYLCRLFDVIVACGAIAGTVSGSGTEDQRVRSAAIRTDVP